ncbi:nucleolar protein 7/estrogen receptor coactivator-related [Holotrichia oblita]|uniref:Nucleolar protein 7/estrogen receptor coactivator-related n=1 Tax=Holotrichia oblita TaxID=644536 RepID=A0ACB9TIN8_HOLOL|nr:nucleolar protein 7/estrogen receptor coactivator-related [Holotrichia oblita]
MDARLSQYINNYLFGKGEARLITVDLERFAELFVYCTRGTVDEKLKVLLISLGMGTDVNDDIPYTLVKEYVESIVSSYMRIQRICNTIQFKSWKSRGCFVSPQNVQRLAESLTYELARGDLITRRSLEVWLQGSTVLGQLLIFVFRHLYSISHRDKVVQQAGEKGATQFPGEESLTGNAEKDRSLIPVCRGLDLIPSYPSILDLNQIVFINAHLPQQYQLEWRFLFSSEIHGESFSTLIGEYDYIHLIVVWCLLVVIFRTHCESRSIRVNRGGSERLYFRRICSANWNLGPNFFGDDSCFLFTLVPKMRIFPSTGYNQHFQYLNLHQQTMPNGLAMGGQHGYCGLWLDQEYGIGHTSESCTTYSNYSQMSHTKNFQYRHLEVWGLGQPPPTAQERGERVGMSVLDGNVEGKALLKMVGRQMHSEGIRETNPS